MPPSPLKEPVFVALKALLQPLGFRKAGGVFSRKLNDVFHLIELQGSRDSTATKAKYTVNIAVFLPDLIYEDVREFTKPSVSASHWRERLGFLAPENQDTWWHATTAAEAERNAQDICVKLRQYALPAFEQLSTSAAVVSFWSSGSSPGITEHQRKEYLARLKTPFHPAQSDA